MAYDKELGVSFIICASPGHRVQPVVGTPEPAFSLDDWSYTAEQLNAMGERAAGSSVRFGYHNHTREFALTDGKTPYVELLRLTDPKKVTFELDCGWVFVAGVNPAEVLKEHPYRISMLHLKDFVLPPILAGDEQGGEGDGAR